LARTYNIDDSRDSTPAKPDLGGLVSGNPVYLANHDARVRVSGLKSASYKRVHRLDQINAKKPAKLLDSKSLTLSFSCKQNLAGFFQYFVHNFFADQYNQLTGSIRASMRILVFLCVATVVQAASQACTTQFQYT
jgi:hypothetical protein